MSVEECEVERVVWREDVRAFCRKDQVRRHIGLHSISVEVCSFDMVGGGDHRALHGSTADRISGVSSQSSTSFGLPTTGRRRGLIPRAR